MINLTDIASLMTGRYIYRLDVKSHDGRTQPSQSFMVSFDVPISKMDEIELAIELTDNEASENKASFAQCSVLKVRHSFSSPHPVIEVLCQRKVVDARNPGRFFEIPLLKQEGTEEEQ